MEFNYRAVSLINDDQIASAASGVKDYISQLKENVGNFKYESPESSISLPGDEELLKRVKKIAEEKGNEKLKYIFVIGIGGSNLGTMAVYDAIYGKLDAFNDIRFPKIVFIDTVDSSMIQNAKKIIDSEIDDSDEVLINLITKSGTTMETIANYEVIRGIISEKFGESSVNNRVIVTTEHDSDLQKSIEETGISSLDIPDQIGGRYSVFSAVGLLPLILSGIDVEKLRDGAKEMIDKSTNENVSENPALVSATLMYLHNENGISISNNFFFNPEMESVGKWYRQLMGESVGKERDVEGNSVNSGITPIVSIGSRDLHSMAQLYFGGPKDKFTNLIYASQKGKGKVPTKPTIPGLVDGIAGKDLSEIMDAIYGGVKMAYRKINLPFSEIIFPEINEFEIGQYLQFKMIEMMYLAKLLNVDAFNQPNVEIYKEEMQNILL